MVEVVCRQFNRQVGRESSISVERLEEGDDFLQVFQRIQRVGLPRPESGVPVGGVTQHACERFARTVVVVRRQVPDRQQGEDAPIGDIPGIQATCHRATARIQLLGHQRAVRRADAEANPQLVRSLVEELLLSCVEENLVIQS